MSLSQIAAARLEAARQGAYATATAALTAATAAVQAGAAPSVSAALATQKKEYRYEWTWNWHAWRRLFAIDKTDMIKKMEAKLREKILQQKGVTKIESMSTTVTKTRNEYVLGIYHNHVEGTTKTVFLSTIKQESSPWVAAVIITVAVAAVLVALFLYLTMKTVSETLKEVPEVAKAVEAVGEAAKAVAENIPLILGLVVVAGVGYVAYREYQKRKK